MQPPFLLEYNYLSFVKVLIPGKCNQLPLTLSYESGVSLIKGLLVPEEEPVMYLPLLQHKETCPWVEGDYLSSLTPFLHGGVIIIFIHFNIIAAESGDGFDYNEMSVTMKFDFVHMVKKGIYSLRFCLIIRHSINISLIRD